MNEIFISYNRQDSSADATALYQSLSSDFGPSAIYWDVNNIPLGARWRHEVEAAVREARVLICLIGPNWVATPAVRLEVETAFRAKVRIIPVLVRGAELQKATSALEPPMKELANLNALSLRHENWPFDISPLLAEVSSLGVGQTGEALPEGGRTYTAALAWLAITVPSGIAALTLTDDAVTQLTAAASVALGPILVAHGLRQERRVKST